MLSATATISLLFGPTFSTVRVGFSPALWQLLFPDLSAAQVCRGPRPGSIRGACSKAKRTPARFPLSEAAGSPPSLLASSSPSRYTDPKLFKTFFFLNYMSLDNSYFFLASPGAFCWKQPGYGITKNTPGAGIPVAWCSSYREKHKTPAENFA